MKEQMSAMSAAASAAIERPRIRTMLMVVGEEMIANLPMTYRAFGPALRSNYSSLVDRVLSIDDDALARVVDRVRWELRQSRETPAGEPLPLTMAERDAFAALARAIRD